MPPLMRCFFILLATLLPGIAMAAETVPGLSLTSHWVGYSALGIFVLAYALVMSEEATQLRKSKPVILAAGLIWALIGWQYASHGLGAVAKSTVSHALEEYAELLLFLIVAMAYVNAMTDRNVFEALRNWLIKCGFGFRALFWITGIMAFFISPALDNLTTSLIMCAVAMAIGGSNTRFVSLACINIVVAANAGGAFSPFGDITTLMVWQAGVLDFSEFFVLFIPCAVNFLIPALCMHFAVPNQAPDKNAKNIGNTQIKRGGKRVIVLFGLTILTAVMFHKYLALPPAMGMMTGLAYLGLLGFYLRRSATAQHATEIETGDMVPVDVFEYVARAEWDTLLFFYGVLLAVAGLGFLGYLSMVSELLYVQWNPVLANTVIGLLSAVIDNIPIMAAVLEMRPEMSDSMWLLVTLTAGVGGSLLSIGSAAGVALMGQARGMYTFFSHLKWIWAIALGYGASILTHLWLNT